MGGWYNYDPDYDYHTFDEGFAPAATSGNGFQRWREPMQSPALPSCEKSSSLESALRREHLGWLLSKNRFPAYCYDKLTCGLIDSQRWANDPDAFAILQRTTDTALRNLPDTRSSMGRVGGQEPNLLHLG